MLKVVIDFGSEVTRISILGQGIVLSEPTYIAYEYSSKVDETLNIKAVGVNAKALFGKTSSRTNVVRPICKGEIVDEEVASDLLQKFFEKIEIKKFSKVHALFCVHVGITREAKGAYLNVSDRLGLGKVSFIETPYTCILGQNVPLSESTPQLTLDIGADTTNIAVSSLDGIIAGLTLNVGGKKIDFNVSEFIETRDEIRIGDPTAERVKNSVASLLPEDNMTVVVSGIDIHTGKPRPRQITSSDIYDIVVAFINKILEYVHLLISKLPAEVASSIYRTGIYVSGGVSRIDGIGEYIAQELKMNVSIADEPQLVNVIGGTTVIANDNLTNILTDLE